MGKHPTTVVVTPTPTEILPNKILSDIINYVLANRYAGDRHPGDHLLYLSQLCSLFNCRSVTGVRHEEIILHKIGRAHV